MKRRTGFGFGGSGFGIALAAAFVILGLACKSQEPSKTADLFPQTGEATGWSRTGETRTFQAENLWEYIDGDAERYIQAGVEKTMTADYKFRDRTDAVVDIHIMKNPDGPRKFMEAEGSSDSRPASVGDDARVYPTSLVFRKGRYLVRVVAYEESPDLNKALVEFGQAIEKKL